ncbi:MAG TPA: FAD-binding oxidoreductase, partial [Bacteroidia bacterium]
SRYGLKAHSAICSGKAAKIDAYLFTGLLHRQNINNQNVQVFERTTVTKMKNSDSSITAETEHGFTIRCRKVIHATGYEALERWSKKLVELKSTYACVSEPIAELPPFFEHTLFWNTEDPYLYIREDSGRIIIGGRDEKYYDPRKRKLLLERKTKALVGDFMKLFPGIKFNPEFEWAGTFASTPDGLPFIGQNEKVPNHYYALGYGGNGITFSAVASVLLAELISDNSEVIPKIFSFNR